MNKKKIYFWVCDFSENSGEGKLAKLFIKDISRKYNCIKIKKNNINILKRVIDYKYISPFYGITMCWLNYFKNRRVAYINYLPLWNFLIFLLLPPKTIIGPITGGANYKNNFNLVRSVIFPMLYKLSELFINIREYNLVFSTDLLKKYLFKFTINKSKFNFVIERFKKKNKKKRKFYDLIIYFRNHKNKISFFPYDLIKKLVKIKFKIIIVGDNLNIDGVKNLGYVKRLKLNNLQSKSKFTIVSNENIYSLFTLECIKNNVKVLIDSKKDVKFFNRDFIKINDNNYYKLKL